MRAMTLSLLVIAALAGMLPAQSQKTVIVPAATPAVPSSRAPAVPDNSGSIQGALKILREMKTANEETLRKQAAMLQQLDELGQAADQLRIYTQRG